MALNGIATENLPLSQARLLSLAALVVFLFLSGCTSTSGDGDAPSAGSDPAPEPQLNLNIPGDEDCVCEEPDAVDHTFLEKGLSALAEGDHIEAVTYFQRYQRMESSPLADWEAAVAIAYDSMLPQSPFYDPAAARDSYEQLAVQDLEDGNIHPGVLMMREALSTFVAMQGEIRDLRHENAQLTADLAKREEAIKQLREITLGQKGAAP